jgi:hypothetical protein
MESPEDIFINSISERKIYYFSTTKIRSSEPHYFICIKRTDNDILIMSCCTTKFDTIANFITSRNLPNVTLVYIPAKNQKSPFPKDTYINCNEPLTFTIEEFKNLFNSKAIKFSGELSESFYEQILTGIHASTMIDAETKEVIPKPECI